MVMGDRAADKEEEMPGPHAMHGDLGVGGGAVKEEKNTVMKVKKILVKKNWANPLAFVGS